MIILSQLYMTTGVLWVSNGYLVPAVDWLFVSTKCCPLQKCFHPQTTTPLIHGHKHKYLEGNLIDISYPHDRTIPIESRVITYPAIDICFGYGTFL